MSKVYKMLYMVAAMMLTLCPAQAPQAQESEELNEAINAPLTPSNHPSIGPGNDVVHLVNGQTLHNVRVLRESGPQVLIKVWEGVAPLRIAHKLVELIEYGPVAMQRDDDDDDTPQVITGAELSAAFHAKLTTHLSEAPISFEGNDFIAVLELLGEEADITLAIEESVYSISREERLWEVEIPPETSFDIILQEYLLRDFPNLAVHYEFDHIRLNTVE